MYDEKTDFEQHERDVAVCLGSLNLSLPHGALVDARVLDVGGGGGMHAGLIAPHVARIYCIDIGNQHLRYGGEFLRLLREKFSRNGHDLPLDRFDFLQADAHELPFRDGWFHVVVSFNAFEHIPEPAAALDEIARVLAPGGVAFLTFDPVWTADSGGHFSHYVPEPWAHLVMDTESYRGRMRAAGAGDAELAEFPEAMNRRRVAEYEALFGAHLPCALERISIERWSGFGSEDHVRHPNHAASIALGYADTELAMRGYRIVLRRRETGASEVGERRSRAWAEITDTLAQWRGSSVHDPDFEAFRAVESLAAIRRVMDVGANRGQSIASLRHVLPGAEIDSFEANPRFHDALEILSTVVGGTVRIHRCGLGREPGTLLLHVPACGDRAFLEEASLRLDYFEKPWVAERFAQRGQLRFDDVEVEIRQGDALELAPDLVKVDVEGAELDVLRGLERTIVAHRPVLLVENSDWPNVTPYLRSLGYAPHRFDGNRLAKFWGTSTNTFYLPAGHPARDPDADG